jgi:hypothetical protein
MTIPGFSAEASLGRTRTPHRQTPTTAVSSAGLLGMAQEAARRPVWPDRTGSVDTQA